MRNGHYTHQRTIIGIEVTNNTPETQDLKFLGVYHRHNRRQGLEVRSIIGDTLYDDSDLTFLSNWIMSVGSVHVLSVGFSTTSLYGGFSGKQFSVIDHRNNGSMNHFSWSLSQFFSDKYFNPCIVQIPKDFVVNFFTEFLQTKIEAGEKLVIIFYLDPRNRDSIGDVAEKMNSIFNEDKKRKILLLI